MFSDFPNGKIIPIRFSCQCRSVFSFLFFFVFYHYKFVWENTTKSVSLTRSPFNGMVRIVQPYELCIFLFSFYVPNSKHFVERYIFVFFLFCFHSFPFSIFVSIHSFFSILIENMEKHDVYLIFACVFFSID